MTRAMAVWRALGPAADKNDPRALRMRMIISTSEYPDEDATIILQELLKDLETDPTGATASVARLTVSSYVDTGIRDIEKFLQHPSNHGRANE